MTDFEQAATKLLNQWSQFGANPNRTLGAIQKKGGVQVVTETLDRQRLCDGFDALAAANRLDLSLEALVVSKEFNAQFEDEQVDFCFAALIDAGYTKFF